MRPTPHTGHNAKVNPLARTLVGSDLHPFNCPLLTSQHGAVASYRAGHNDHLSNFLLTFLAACLWRFCPCPFGTNSSMGPMPAAAISLAMWASSGPDSLFAVSRFCTWPLHLLAGCRWDTDSCACFESIWCAHTAGPLCETQCGPMGYHRNVVI